MKYIITDTQTARELRDLGGLTITKPIKPKPPYIEGAAMTATGSWQWVLVAADGRKLGAEDGAADFYAPQVQAGDAVYIREPWIRLQNPDGSPSDRVHLMADALSDDQDTCKWHPAASMPEDAACRFARVDAVAPVYDENVMVWEITLSLITKEAAIQMDMAEDEADSEETPESIAPDTPTDETGSFTVGKCRYCGREWGVSLEGAEGGGYPTQRTADAAASRVCNCPEAVNKRQPEIGVAFAIMRGSCQYCGQVQEVGPHSSQAAADETATEVCSCGKARIARRLREQIEDAKERVNSLFGTGAEDFGFSPINSENTITLLETVAEGIARDTIASAVISIRGWCRAKFSVNSKGEIKISRSETRSRDI